MGARQPTQRGFALALPALDTASDPLCTSASNYPKLVSALASFTALGTQLAWGLMRREVLFQAIG